MGRGRERSGAEGGEKAWKGKGGLHLDISCPAPRLPLPRVASYAKAGVQDATGTPSLCPVSLNAAVVQ